MRRAMRHLLRSWDVLAKKLRRAPLILFLDFDGTLSPIVEAPSRAVLPAATRGLLRRLVRLPGVRVAVISGRALRDVRSRVGVPGVIYAGNHGLEVEGPKIRHTCFVPRGYAASLSSIKRSIEEAVRPVRGAFVEDKGLSLSLHYRLVSGGDRPRVKTLFHKAVIVPLVRGSVRIRSGKKVLEVLPPVDWNKGRIVLWLIARQRMLGAGGTPVALYFGDDKTDEDAFRALRRGGTTVLVGSPRRSRAQYFLRDTKEVSEFLSLILHERSQTP